MPSVDSSVEHCDDDAQTDAWIRKQSEMTEAIANLSKRTAPYKRPSKPYSKMVDAFNSSKALYARALEDLKETGRGEYNFTRISVERHSCLKNLGELKPILLREMKVNQIHYGRYLECHVLSQPYARQGACYLITDTEGKEAEIINMFNFNFDLRVKDCTDSCEIVSKGSRVILKEPYLKFVSVNKDFLLRVDSPTDVVFTQDKTSLKFDDLMEMGKKNFLAKKYLLALKFYSQAFGVKSDSSRALLNRSAVFLQLNNYQSAYSDAARSTELEASEKGYYRMGRATYLMRQFERSVESYQKCIDFNPLSKDACMELKRAKDRVEEARTGVYDFKAWVDTIKNGAKHDMDCADFKSNDIEVVEIKKGYMGVKSVRPIKKGTLLMASKAVSVVFEKEIDVLGAKFLSFDKVNRPYTKGTSLKNFSNIIKKMQADPELTQQIYKLYAGPNYDRSQPIDKSIVDVTRLDAIMQYNQLPIADISDLENNKSDNSALFTLPSFFNHSCVPNLKQLSIGDVMLISASRDIKEGEELFIRYIMKEGFTLRKACLLSCGINCKCELCYLDENDPKLKLRDSIEQNHLTTISYGIMRNPNLKPIMIQHLKKTVSENISNMKAAYKHRTDSPVQLKHLFNSMATLNAMEQNYEEAARFCLQIYECSKEIVQYEEFTSLFALVDAFILFQAASNNVKKRWCYEKASELFFTGSRAYFEYVFEIVKNDRNKCGA